MTNNIEQNISTTINDKIVEALKTVYDPEFPVVDIYTLGLIYDISYSVEKKEIYILMTLTSPACPVWDMIIDMVKNATKESNPEFTVNAEITFDPMWSPDMIKDEDLKRMFDV